MSALFLQFWPYIAGAAGIVLAFWKVHAMGAKANEAKHVAADAKATTEAQKIDDAVAGRAPNDNRKRLGEWSKS